MNLEWGKMLVKVNKEELEKHWFTRSCLLLVPLRGQMSGLARKGFALLRWLQAGWIIAIPGSEA